MIYCIYVRQYDLRSKPQLFIKLNHCQLFAAHKIKLKIIKNTKEFHH